MPHDIKGRVVEVGQRVRMDFIVKLVAQTDEYCNVNLESVHGMPPSGTKTTVAAVNTKQIEVVEDADWRKVEVGK